MREKLKMAKFFGNLCFEILNKTLKSWKEISYFYMRTFAKLVHAQSFCNKFSFRRHKTKLYIVLNKVTCIIIQQKIKNNFLKIMNHGVVIADWDFIIFIGIFSTHWLWCGDEILARTICLKFHSLGMFLPFNVLFSLVFFSNEKAFLNNCKLLKRPQSFIHFKLMKKIYQM